MKLNKNLSEGTSSNNVDNFHSFPVSSISPTFGIDQVAVWGLGPQPDYEEERESVEPREPNWDINNWGQPDLDDIVDQIRQNGK